MNEARPPVDWLLTPLVAFAGTVIGVPVLFFAQARLLPLLAGGFSALCGSPDCGLGIGIMLIAAGFVVVCASFVAGWIVAIRHRRQAGRRGALRRGLLVCLWCLVAYAVASVAVWGVV